MPVFCCIKGGAEIAAIKVALIASARYSEALTLTPMKHNCIIVVGTILVRIVELSVTHC